MQVQQFSVSVGAGHQLIDTALVQQDELALALLLQGEGRKGGSIRLFSLSSATFHQLAEPNNGQQEVRSLPAFLGL